MKKLSDKVFIKNVKLNNRLILAPMAGITDAAYRKICIKHKAGLVVSEMISDHGFFYKNKKTDIYLKSFNERPLAFQIFGSNLNYLINLAKYIDNLNYVDIIDINMGCPIPKVCDKSKAGAYYLKHPELAKKLVSSLVKVIKKPLTVKIRSGWDSNNINAVSLAKDLEFAGASAITIHARTKKALYSGNADWDIIKKIKKNVSIPVIGNGDVKDYKSAKKMLEYTNCDMVMIGRSALGKPYIFDEILQNEKGKSYKISLQKIIKTLKKHYMLLAKLHSEKVAKLKMKTHVSHYLKPYKQLKEIRQNFVLSGDFKQLIKSLNGVKRF